MSFPISSFILGGSGQGGTIEGLSGGIRTAGGSIAQSIARGFIAGAPPGIAVPTIAQGVKTAAQIAAAAAGAFLGTATGPATLQAPGVFLDACGNRVDAQGCPIKKRRRSRGITATELRGFKKVNCLLDKVGKEPRRPVRRKVC